MPDEKAERAAEKTANSSTALMTEEHSPDSAAASSPSDEITAPVSGPEPVAEGTPAPDSVARGDYDQLKSERDQLLDRLARMQAEFENARKRTERERQEFRDYATGNVVEQFLPVLDNFSLALKSTGSAEQLRSGVELIVKQMDEVLRQLQVTPVPAVGELFDPRLHEALGSVERDDLPDQHIAEEVRRGYRLRDRLLRPALVRIVSNPKQKSE